MQKSKIKERMTFMSLKKDAVAEPFVRVEEDENGVLKNITFTNDDNFNFA